MPSKAASAAPAIKNSQQHHSKPQDANKKTAVAVPVAAPVKPEEYNYPNVDSGESTSATPTQETVATLNNNIDNNTSNDNGNSANERSPATKKNDAITTATSNDDVTSESVVAFEASAAVVSLPSPATNQKDASPLLTSRSMRSARSGSFREDSSHYAAGDDSTPRMLGTTGTRSFRSTAKRFTDPAAGPKLTSHIDALPMEAISLLGKTGPKASFTKAQDRFKVPDVATKDAQTYYVPTSPFGGTCTPRPGSEVRRSPNRSRLSSDDSEPTQQPVLTRGTSGILAGGGQRFKEAQVATVETPLYELPSTITTKRSFRTAQGLTAPRFGPAKVVEKSQATTYQEARSKIDNYVPPGFTAKCQPQATPSSSTRGTMPNTKRFHDFREPITKDVDVAEDVVGTTTLLSKKAQTPGSSAFRSTAPRFGKTRTAAQGGEAYVPKGFVDHVLSK
jgi:hypothetical protein